MIEAAAPRSAQWLGGQRQLWSLYDMLQFNAALLVDTVQNIEKVKGIIDHYGEAVARDPGHTEMAREWFTRLADHLAFDLDYLPVSESLRGQLKRFRVAATTEPLDRLVWRIQEIQIGLQEDLKDQVFYSIAREDAKLIKTPGDFWSPDLHEAFPDAAANMRSCVRCMALDMPTASVYHAMCAVQHGLRRLADQLGVAFSRDFDVLEWSTIIRSIDAKLKAMMEEPKSVERDARIKFGAEASSHFFAIKEAWRNYVMHGRGDYAPDDARSIGSAVRDILRALA